MLPASFRKAVQGRQVIPFVGCGVSRSVHRMFPMWNDLLVQLVDAVRGENGERDAIFVESLNERRGALAAADEVVNLLGSTQFCEVMSQLFNHPVAPSDADLSVPELLWGMNPKGMITTNYDNVLRWPRPEVVSFDSTSKYHLGRVFQNENPWVWHVHGRAEVPETIVLSTSHYDREYAPEGSSTSAAMQQLSSFMTNHTLLFVGFSLKDKYVMDQLECVLDRFDRTGVGKHFALMKKDEAELREVWEKYHIQVIEFDDFGEPMLEVLREMCACATAGDTEERRRSSEQPPNEIPACPELPVLPQADWPELEQRFWGRERQLTDISEGLEGLLLRGGEEQPRYSKAAKLFWISGFGGMGKSWILRRTIQLARDLSPEIRCALVDWDSNTWSSPLHSPPNTVTDLCKPIAVRITQLYGGGVTSSFWQALQRVERNAAERAELTELFDSYVDAFCREVTEDDTQAGDSGSPAVKTDPVLASILGREMDKDRYPNSQRRLFVERLREDKCRRSALFQEWAETSRRADLSDDHEATLRPEDLLIDVLSSVLRDAALTHPLTLLLDTCEVLPADLDSSLRQLLLPLCNGNCPIVIVLASRLKADAAATRGVRDGWNAELDGASWRKYEMDDTATFTKSELMHGLRALGDESLNLDAISDWLLQVTEGVPLAVGLIMDLHRLGDRILQDLDSLMAELPAGQSEGCTTEIIEEVARRFLLHLLDRPDREQDLRDIITLAMLQSADRQILQTIWGTRPRARLRELAARYSLLADGDLHATVRSFLRRYLRNEDFRGDVGCFDSQLEKLLEALNELTPPGLTPEDDRFFELLPLQINARSWYPGTQATVARGLAVALTYDSCVREVCTLALEALGDDLHDDERNALQWISDTGLSHTWITEDLVPLISRHKGDDWNDIEQESLLILQALQMPPHTPKDARVAGKQCLDLVEQRPGLMKHRRANDIADFMGDCAITLINEKHSVGDVRFGRRLLETSLSIQDTSLHRNAMGTSFVCLNEHQGAIPHFERALELDGSNGDLVSMLAAMYYYSKDYEKEEKLLREFMEKNGESAELCSRLGEVVQEDSKRLDEAEQLFRTALECDPDYAAAYNGLGLLYHHELRDHEKAEDYYRKAIELDHEEYAAFTNLAVFQKSHLHQYEESESNYQRAIDLRPLDPSGHYSLAELYRAWLGQYDDAERCYLDVLQISPDHLDANNGLGRLYLYHRTDYEKARRQFERTRETHPEQRCVYYNLGTLAIRQGRFDDGTAMLEKAVELVPDHRSTVEGLAKAYRLSGSEKEDECWDRAEALHNKRLTEGDDTASAKNSFAWFLLEQGERLDKARQLALDAVNHKQDRHNLHTLAEIELEMGMTVEAQEHLDQWLDTISQHDMANSLVDYCRTFVRVLKTDLRNWLLDRVSEWEGDLLSQWRLAIEHCSGNQVDGLEHFGLCVVKAMEEMDRFSEKHSLMLYD